MKVFVTGAKGFVGRELVSQLKKESIEVIETDVFDLDEPNYFKIDINSQDIEDIMPENLDAIIHLAALSNDKACKNNALECFNVNVMGTLNLIEVAERKNAKQFIFASSEWVYTDFKENEVKDEESFIDILKHTSEYALSKLVSEANLKQKYEDGFANITILRFGIIYGRRESGSAVESIFKSVKKQHMVEIGSMKTGRCFIEVSDIASGIVKSLGLKKFNVINLQGDSLITLGDIVETSKKVLNKDIEVIETKPGNVNLRNVSNTRAKKILNWSPKVDLESGLHNLNSFLTNNKIWKCLICNSSNYGEIFSYDKPDQYERAASVEEKDYFRSWVKCKDCGFIYSVYSRDGKAFDKLYGNKYRNDNSSWRNESVEEAFNRVTSLPENESSTKEKVNWIKKNIKIFQDNNLINLGNPPYNLLDIGGGSGIFAYEFSDVNWTPHIIDPGLDEIFFRNRLKFQFVKDYYGPGMLNVKFHLVSMIYVLEHLTNPRSILQSINEDMHQESLLYVEVPDSMAFIKKSKEDDIFNSTHLWMFDPKSIINLLDSCGFIVLSLDRTKSKRGNYVMRVIAIREQIFKR